MGHTYLRVSSNSYFPICSYFMKKIPIFLFFPILWRKFLFFDIFRKQIKLFLFFQTKLNYKRHACFNYIKLYWCVDFKWCWKTITKSKLKLHDSNCLIFWYQVPAFYAYQNVNTKYKLLNMKWLHICYYFKLWLQH